MRTLFTLTIVLLGLASSAQDSIYSYSQHYFDRAGLVFDSVPGYPVVRPNDGVRTGVDFVWGTNKRYNMLVDEEFEFYIVDDQKAKLGDTFLIYHNLEDLRELVIGQLNVFWENRPRRVRDIDYATDKTP